MNCEIIAFKVKNMFLYNNRLKFKFNISVKLPKAVIINPLLVSTFKLLKIIL